MIRILGNLVIDMLKVSLFLNRKQMLFEFSILNMNLENRALEVTERLLLPHLHLGKLGGCRVWREQVMYGNLLQLL